MQKRGPERGGAGGPALPGRSEGRGMPGLSVRNVRDLVRFAAWVVLAFGLFVSAYAVQYVSQQVARDAAAKFEVECAAVERIIAMHLASYTDLLLGLSGFIHHDPGVTRDQFRDYALALDLHNRHPGVTSIDYAVHVPAAHKAAFERSVRADRSVIPQGYPRFAIEPAGARTSYHPLTFIEPLTASIELLGIDVQAYAEGASEAFDVMRNSGDITSVPDVAAEDRRWGARLALYHRDRPLVTVEQRRAALRGSVGVRFSLVRLMRTALPAQAAEHTRLRLYSYPGALAGAPDFVPAQQNLLIDSAALWPQQAADGAGKPLRVRLERPFGGRTLLLEFSTDAKHFTPGHERAEPYFVGALGAVATLLLFALLRSLLRSRLDLEGAVQARTRELSGLYERVREDRDQRIRLEREILTAAEDERARLGRELHDDIGQLLTATACLAQSLSQDLESRWKEGSAQAGAIETHLSNAVERTRLLSQGLMPLASQVGSISLALEQLARHARESFRIGCDVECTPADIVEAPEVAQELYRISQEAVLNAVKHGRASRVSIELSIDAVTQRLRLLIADDGVGIDTEKALRSDGVGMRIMRRRSRAIGLELSVRRRPGGGTVVRVE